MRLYLVQHGDALAKEVDPDRPLSEMGRADVERLAGLMSARRVRAERVVHSGKTRAEQTASILAAAMAPGTTIEAMGGLAPNDPVVPLADQAATWSADTVVVGHLPFMDKCLARLVRGAEGPGVVAFRPGGMTCLERDEAGRWTVAWMIRPELLGD